MINQNLSPQLPAPKTKQDVSRQFSFLSEKFINLLMIDGKKLKANQLFFEMLSFLKTRIPGYLEKKSLQQSSTFHEKDSIVESFSRALENVMPSLEVRKVRIAGTTYFVPSILSKKRQETLAIRWIIESAKKRKKNSKSKFSQCLAEELLDALKKQGQARQKREDLHRLAQANRAFIRYRWW